MQCKYMQRKWYESMTEAPQCTNDDKRLLKFEIVLSVMLIVLDHATTVNWVKCN